MPIKYPDYFVAIDHKNNRIFVLAKPNLSALFNDGVWDYVAPISEEELERYELVTDVQQALKIVEEAKKALAHLGVK